MSLDSDDGSFREDLIAGDLVDLGKFLVVGQLKRLDDRCSEDTLDHRRPEHVVVFHR